MKTWKAKEKQLTEWLTEWGPWQAVRKSRALRGERVEDVAWGPFSVELKTRKSTPSLEMLGWLEQAEANCDGKVPIVIAHRDSMRKGEQVVMMTIATFTDLIEKAFDKDWVEEGRTL